MKPVTKGGTTKDKDISGKKKKKILAKQAPATSSPESHLSSSFHSSTSHQQHHSAPPPQSQQSKAGLQSINENVEYLPNIEQQQQPQQQQQQNNARFPRSSTVPYPAYATLRQRAGNPYPTHYYYTDYPAFIHGTISPAQANTYFNTRQPLSSVNSNFQPISPHHPQYANRPVDILKPTFLIVPKEAEQQLSAQLSTSNSPVPPSAAPTVKNTSKTMSKETKTKTQDKTTSIIEQSSPTGRSVEVQTNNQSPTRTTTAGITTMDNTHQHVTLMATPNPSPYVHFVNVPYPTQSPQFLQDGPPETSIIQDEFITINDYHQPSASIRSMPNIALAQGKILEYNDMSNLLVLVFCSRLFDYLPTVLRH